MMWTAVKIIMLVICMATYSLLSCTSTADIDSTLTIIPAKLSTQMPLLNTAYQIVVPPFLYETHDQNPQNNRASFACSLANELVFRTGLRNLYLFPSAAVIPQENDFIVRFNSVTGKGFLIARVNVEKNQVTIEKQA